MNGGVVLLADTHFANRTSFGRFNSHPEFPGCNSRLHEAINACRQAVDYAVKHDCESIVILGDVFHDRGIIDVPVYNAVYQLFEEIANKGLKLIVYPGNHDYVDLAAMHADKHLHSLFMYNKLSSIIDSPSIVSLDCFFLGIIPFCKDTEQIIDNSVKLAAPKPDRPQLLLLHHSINGAVTGPHEWQMPHKLDPYKLDQRWTRIFSGHYHKHQKCGPATYVGSPLHHDFNERTYVPGFVHVKPNGDWVHIENTISPRFCALEVNDSSKLTDLQDTKNYVSIRYTGDVSELDKVKKFVSDNCVVEHRPKGSNASIRTDIESTDAVEDMIKKFTIAKKGEDPELIKKGIDIYKATS